MRSPERQAGSRRELPVCRLAWSAGALAFVAAGCGAVSFKLGRSSEAGNASQQAPGAAGAVDPSAAGKAASGAADAGARKGRKGAEAPGGAAADLREAAAIASALQSIQSRQAAYRLTPADLIEVTVFQEPELSRKIRVGPDGRITFPLVGGVKLGGLTVPEAEAEIAGKLKRFLVSPSVSVFIADYGNKTIYIMGEVNKPGSYQLPTEASLSVLEALTLAGGFTQFAAPDKTKVIRRAEGRSVTYTIEVSAIMRRGDKAKDMELKPNDVIFVPEGYF